MKLFMACVITALVLPVSPRTIDASALDNFELVGTNDLGARGMNAGFAIAGDCGYVGSRSGTQGVLILDLADPAVPAMSGEIPVNAGSTPREVRAIAALDLLVVLNYRLDPASGSLNGLDLYDISSCREPVFRSRVDFGEAMPHEFFLWRDPSSQRKDRVLAYVTMWGHAPNLRVIDLTEPERPVEVATWDAASVTGFASRIHSLTVSRDGERAYLADWDSGLMVLDTTGLAQNREDLTPMLLTPVEGWLLPAGGNLHSALYVRDRELVVTTQEIYGPGTCPYGDVHLVDVADPTSPRFVGQFGIDENDQNRCGETESRDGAFTSHNPLVVGDILFVSWYAGGLRAIDISDPSGPQAAGVFVPDPLPSVAADDVTLQSVPIRIWSSPIVRDGLIYVVDIRNGLFVLRYTGPEVDVIGATRRAEGNAS